MVNVYFNWSSLLGISIAVAGAGLYFLRSVQPRLARDHDIFFAAVGLLCGGILFFQGWRQDPILQFGQFLLGGSAIFFGVESVRLRGVATDQAKRNTRIVDDERPVSKVYSYVDAELERLEPEEDMTLRPRIRGRDEARPRRNSEGYYEDDEPRRPKSTRKPSSNDDDYGTSEPKGKRKPRPTTEKPNSDRYDDWDGSVETEEPYTSTSRPANRKPTDPNRPKRRRPPEDERRRPAPTSETRPSDEYVDYQPVNPNEDDDETDNDRNFDY